MLADYISVGFSADTFWRITLREFNAHMSGASKRLDREHRERAWLAYSTAALSGVPGKDFPKFEDLVNPKPQKKDSLLEIAEQWNAAVNARAS